MAAIYISDLDGTLLRNDATLSEFARNGIARLLAANVHFTIASARSLAAMRIILGDIPFNLPIVEFNGAFISDFQTGRHEIVNSFGEDTARGLYGLIVENGHVPFVSTFNGQEDCVYYTRLANFGMEWFLSDRTKAGDRRLRTIPDLRESLRDQVVCLTAIDREEPLAELMAQVEEAFPGMTEMSFYQNRYSPGWFWLTISDRRASKDQAIGILAERLDVSAEKITVFGDDVNDVRMFKMAGRAIAVQNAKPEVKACAHEVIGTNEEDSVISYILRDAGID